MLEELQLMSPLIIQAAYTNRLSSVSNESNIRTMINYINIMKTEVNLSDHYRRALIELLSRFSNYLFGLLCYCCIIVIIVIVWFYFIGPIKQKGIFDIVICKFVK